MCNMDIFSLLFGTPEPVTDAIQQSPVYWYIASDSPPTNYTVIDVETTGLDPCKFDLLEVGAVRYRNHTQVAKFHTYVRPSGKIPAAATRINHIRWPKVSRAPLFCEVSDRFLEFIGDDDLIGYNIGFDVKFLQTRGRFNIQNLCFDVLSFVKSAYPDLPRYRLDDLRKCFNITGASHNAIDDCIATAKVFQRCLKTGYGEYLIDQAEYLRGNALQQADYRNETLRKNSGKYKAACEQCIWDTMDDSCFKCFVVGDSTANELYIRNQDEIIDCIKTECAAAGGHYYKTPAKSANAVVLLGVDEQNKARAEYWKARGYKIISPVDFLCYCGHRDVLTQVELSSARNKYLAEIKDRLGCF